MNISSRLSVNAKATPEKTAVIFPHFDKKSKTYTYSSLTFKELETLSNRFALQLLKRGFKQGDKTLLFLKPSLDFHAMAFALFKIGVVPVFIDPGMGIKSLLKCIKDTKPIGLISEGSIHFIKHFYPRAFKSVKISISNGSPLLKKILRINCCLSEMKKERIQLFNPIEIDPLETAAILFTSGGTGTPKGVVYTHHIFNQQTIMLQNLYGLTPNDTDLPGFPLFSLFTIAMGMTSCIPDMDPTKPGSCDPSKLVQNITDQKATFVAGSPAIWERVADYCLEHKLTLPSVKYLVMFGAPVALKLHYKFKSILTNGTTYTPYGATEALPVSHISGEFILKNTARLTEEGHGTCIGPPVPNVEIKIIKITDENILKFNSNLELPINEVGEIIVRAEITSKEYLNLPEKTAEAKIYNVNGTYWHRMGDLGFIDEKGLLWFCGRKSHMVTGKDEILYPIPCEAIFNKHCEVKASALVGLGKKGEEVPAIVILRKDGQYLSGKSLSLFENELFSLAKKYPHTKNIQKIYLCKTFPLDVRHNIKIDRLKLKKEIEHYEIH